MMGITLNVRVKKQLKDDLERHVKKLSKKVGFPVSVSTYVRDLIVKSLKSGS